MIRTRQFGPGDFEMHLTEVPAEMLARLTVMKGASKTLGAATVVVTDAWVDPDTLGNGDTGTAFHPLFDLATWCGVLTDIPERSTDGDVELRGYGIAWHLGSHENTGEVFPGNAMRAPENNTRWVQLYADDWVDWLTMGGGRLSENGAGPAIILRPAHLYGTLTPSSPTPSVPYFPDVLTRREILTRICEYIDWTWYVTPQMVVVAGEQADLFPAQRAIIAVGLDEDDQWWTIPTSRIVERQSMDGYSNKLLAFDSSAATSWAYPNDDTTPDEPSDDFYGPDGTPLHVVSREDADAEENILSWGARAEALVPLRATTTRSFAIDGIPNDQGRVLIPGEQLFMWDPRLNLVDEANECHVGGELLAPVAFDLVSIERPVVDGQGVFVVFWDPAINELDHIDLTPFFVFEDGDATTIEVGAAAKAL